MKSYKRRIEEGRCQGIGTDYVPFITSREARSIGTSSSIYDPIEGRLVHVLSTVESDLYYMLRWNPDVKYIREQYLLDTELMNVIAKELGVSVGNYYTTDFLIDYHDGSQKAYSVKSSKHIFDLENREYRGNKKKLNSLVNRQKMEMIYWESQGVPFAIVTQEDINLDLVTNVKNVMSCYQELRVTNTVQKLMYLIAHRIIEVPMDVARINFQKLAQNATFDIDDLYEKVQMAKEVYINDEQISM